MLYVIFYDRVFNSAGEFGAHNVWRRAGEYGAYTVWRRQPRRWWYDVCDVNDCVFMPCLTVEDGDL